MPATAAVSPVSAKPCQSCQVCWVRKGQIKDQYNRLCKAKNCTSKRLFLCLVLVGKDVWQKYLCRMSVGLPTHLKVMASEQRDIHTLPTTRSPSAPSSSWLRPQKLALGKPSMYDPVGFQKFPSCEMFSCNQLPGRSLTSTN